MKMIKEIPSIMIIRMKEKIRNMHFKIYSVSVIHRHLLMYLYTLFIFIYVYINFECINMCMCLCLDMHMFTCMFNECMNRLIFLEWSSLRKIAWNHLNHFNLYIHVYIYIYIYIYRNIDICFCVAIHIDICS